MRNAGEPHIVDLQPDRPDLAERPPRGALFRLVTGPEHVLAPESSALAGYYRAVFSSDTGETLERYLTNAGHAEILRRRGTGDPTMSSEEFLQWTVAPDIVALEARYEAEAGQGA